jgi:hypothetical protein
MGTWIVGAVVVYIVGLAAYKVYKDYQSGKGCGHGCEGCRTSGSCHNEK